MSKRRDILIVEDEEMLRQIMEEFMDSLGYCVDAVENAEDALKLYLEENHRLIISDIHLPSGMDGLQMMETIRSVNQDVPIILITGYNVNKVRKIVEGKRLIEFIEKPFKPFDLVPLINKYIGKPENN